MTCLKALRTEGARLPIAHALRQRLFDIADELAMAVDELSGDVSRENMVQLNGIWSRAAALLKFVQSTTPTTPLGGAMPAPQAERKIA